ncbi:MAG: ABC transporter ATP-binding protein [Spirochaetaceae bacterium]|nr:MAG: ABC transporter ATP-binding protein [Spirochaetaceae bacterium]
MMITLEGVAKSYDLGASKLTALKGVSLSIKRGEFVTIMGPSGSGKSTLLHILGILDTPSSGSYRLEEYDITTLSDTALSRIRNKHFGFVFQSFNLFPEFNALENVEMPLLYAGAGKAARRDRARQLLDEMGLGERMFHYPNMLSGGEQQRVAIARALANNPTLILADEPTGNLPSDKGEEIMQILEELNRNDVTIVMVTHDPELGKRGRKTVHLHDGSIESIEERGNGAA